MGDGGGGDAVELRGVSEGGRPGRPRLPRWWRRRLPLVAEGAAGAEELVGGGNSTPYRLANSANAEGSVLSPS